MSPLGQFINHQSVLDNFFNGSSIMHQSVLCHNSFFLFNCFLLSFKRSPSFLPFYLSFLFICHNSVGFGLFCRFSGICILNLSPFSLYFLCSGPYFLCITAKFLVIFCISLACCICLTNSSLSMSCC